MTSPVSRRRAVVESTAIVVGGCAAVSIGLALTTSFAGFGGLALGLVYWIALRREGERCLDHGRRARWDGLRDLPLPEELAAWFTIVTVVLGIELSVLGVFAPALGNLAAAGFVGMVVTSHVAIQRHFHPAVVEPVLATVHPIVRSGREAARVA